ncbi:MAG: AraC family transcriptional regulator [Lentisphaeria bacterium]
MAKTPQLISDAAIIPAGCRERFLPLNQAAAAPLVRRGASLAGVSDLVPPYEIRRRQPPFHLALFTLAGNGRWWSPGHGEGQCCPGELWLVPAGVPVRYLADGAWRILWFHLDAIPLWAAAAGLAGPESRPAPQLNVLLAAVEGWLAEAAGPDRPLAAAATAHYAELTGILLERELPAAGHADWRWRSHLQALREKVEQHPAGRWPVAAMARELHLSPTHFHRLLREREKTSPAELVAAARMRLARDLLRFTDYPLKVIAGRCGYATPFSFSRAFSKHNRTSPDRFRRQAGTGSSPQPPP